MNQSNCMVAQSGGPTAAINASLAGVISGIKKSGKYDTCYGAINGILGILNERYLNLSQMIPDEKTLNRLKVTPAMYLGSCRHKLPDYKDDDSAYVFIFNQFAKLNIKAFFYIGGNDSMDTVLQLSTYAKLHEKSVTIMGVPKTIDNDIWGTDMTFGFQSAVNIATECIDCIHTTAASHGRVFIVEVMGHKVGWLTLNAGMAGGADIILIPEIPYDIDKVVAAINDRHKKGSKFTILAVAEGAISKEDAKLSKKEYKEKMKNYKFPSVSYELAAQIQERTGQEVRVTVPGHTQRGGSPCPYDRVFASRLGAEAGELILKGEYGFMVGYKNREVVKVPLEDVAGKLKMVSPDASIIREAKHLGISFGD